MKTSRGFGFIGTFFITVTILSFAELYLLIEVAAYAGFLTTLSLCILTGIVGGSLVRAQGLKAISQINHQVSKGKLPAVEIVEGLLLLVLGALLLTPGFITDTFGFCLLVPPIRRATAKVLILLFKNKVTTTHVRYSTEDTKHHTTSRHRETIIEVDAKEI